MAAATESITNWLAPFVAVAAADEEEEEDDAAEAPVAALKTPP